MIKTETITVVFWPLPPLTFPQVSLREQQFFYYFERNVSGHSNDNCLFKLRLRPA